MCSHRAVHTLTRTTHIDWEHHCAPRRQPPSAALWWARNRSDTMTSACVSKDIPMSRSEAHRQGAAAHAARRPAPLCRWPAARNFSSCALSTFRTMRLGTHRQGTAARAARCPGPPCRRPGGRSWAAAQHLPAHAGWPAIMDSRLSLKRCDNIRRRSSPATSAGEIHGTWSADRHTLTCAIAGLT